MKVTIAFLFVSLCMDVCLSQKTTTKPAPMSTAKNNITAKIASTTTATETSSSIITSPASISIFTTSANVSSITNPASGGTTTSRSRGSNSACMPPFLAVLSVVGFLLL